MAIINPSYDMPFGQSSNAYVTKDDKEAYENWLKNNGWWTGTSPTDGSDNNPTSGTDTDGTVTGGTKTTTETTTTPAAETTPTTGNDSYDTLLKQIEDMTKSGSISDQYKAAILAAVKAQQMTTQQAIDKINFQKYQTDQARVKANREADLTFSRAINPTGKINENIRSAGLAGSGWQETSQVGLTNAYQNALNTNSSDYNNAVKELNLAISQAKQSGDIATMQAIQTYAIQLAQQLYQEARAAVADAQWEKSYALQKAAFDLEHAAQTGSNGTTIPTSPAWSGSWPSPKETVSEADSKAAMEAADREIQAIWGSSKGDDFVIDAAVILSNYYGKMTSKDLDALASKYGIDPNKL